MVIYENTLISDDIFEKAFVCDLNSCKGACCIEGDSGAPLREAEIDIIEHDLDAIMPFMEKELVAQVKNEGFWEKDAEGDLVTRCKNGRECVFVTMEDGIYKCSIENAWKAGKTTFRKPVSCHLYPIRLSQVGEYTALNYSHWHICSAACKLGEALQVPVYEFLKDSLISHFGAAWYEELAALAVQYRKGTGR
ncbi:MAG: DUF3109 family protein [Bacteroidota bacterium]|nr:DUF3109 family protein [Bacteroidota bacterium]